MTPRISTGRERRVRHSPRSMPYPDERTLYARDGIVGLVEDTRTGQDRRVASYRIILDRWFTISGDTGRMDEMILALRKPAAVEAAVERERERCALIVERGADEGPVGCDIRGCMAAAIRGGKS